MDIYPFNYMRVECKYAYNMPGILFGRLKFYFSRKKRKNLRKLNVKIFIITIITVKIKIWFEKYKNRRIFNFYA